MNDYADSCGKLFKAVGHIAYSAFEENSKKKANSKSNNQL